LAGLSVPLTVAPGVRAVAAARSSSLKL
jgi:hypothetical protein